MYHTVEAAESEGMGGAWKMGEDAVRKNIDSWLSDSTIRQYSRTWQKYLNFCKTAKVSKFHLTKHDSLTECV